MDKLDKDFCELVHNMRVAQRRYFRTKSQQAKRESIVLESQVDKALKVPHSNDLQKTIQRMRSAQQRYFKTGSVRAKDEAIQLEKLIDEHLATLVPDEQGLVQGELF